jgi:cyclophilin family peptidyl-prolyl cis-trans isomerase
MLRSFLFLLALTLAPAALAANPKVELRTTLGTIVIDLYPENAPKTVENFLQYVKDGFYDGTIFHRVIPGFMTQGGGFTRNLQQKPTRPAIRNEAGNGLRNAIGTVAMARTKDPHSATAQFFINVADNDFLDFKSPDENGYGYTVFGRVSSGMDVVQKMVQVPTATMGPHQNVPRTPIVIERARVLEAAPAKPKPAKAAQ